MRFLVDMGISPVVAERLRNLGHDAYHLRDQGLQRLHDSLILEKARTEGRVLLTSDLDFGYLVAVSGAALPSVILFRLSDMRPDSICTYLDVILHRFEKELSAGSIIVAKESGIRVRRLPIGEGVE